MTMRDAQHIPELDRMKFVKQKLLPVLAMLMLFTIMVILFNALPTFYQKRQLGLFQKLSGGGGGAAAGTFLSCGGRVFC